MRTIVAPAVPAPPCRYEAPTRDPLRVALVQHQWHADPDDLRAELAEGIAAAAREGARAVFLPELTLRRYPAFERAGTDPGADAEDLHTGPTATFAAEMARTHDLFVHASMYQRSPAPTGSTDDGLGLNTAILVSPAGEIVAHTHKLHIPISPGYYEDTYFRGGPADDPYPVHRPEGLDAAIGLPTCWDEWFAEVTRSYSLAGAEILVYPTAIGSEPDFPEFDTQPLWQQVIVGNAIANATFMVVPNRHGDEGAITFYGSSFICDPFGRILVQAPRDESVTLVADLELDQRRDWLSLFPFLATRRPDTYASPDGSGDTVTSGGRNWRMPAETAVQERVWMAYPVAGYSLGNTETEHEEARATWAAVAHAVADFEPVTVIVDPGEISHARRHLSSEITLVEAPLDDAWARDIGPTFVLDENGALGAVDWVFNGWGAADWATWDNDQHIATLIAELAGAELVDSPMINEGGGIQVDGAGTVLLTETVQRGEGRNSTWSREQVEAELARTIGTTTAIWLPRGLTRDNDTFGTRGHVDIVAGFPTPGTVLVHDQTDPTHPDHAVTAEIIGVLSAATDAAGSPLEIIRVPAPHNLTDAGGFVDHSYINHLVVNGGVIACAFDDPSDAPAAEILADVYPGREVVTVDARPLFDRGGGVHCITCQQPSRRHP